MRHWPRRPTIWRRNKYHARKVVEDGYTFDSMAEHRQYRRLKALYAAGHLVELLVHPRFELQPKPHKIVFVADFQLTYPDGRVEVQEVKGVATAAWLLKQKLFLAKYPDLPLVVVKGAS